MQPRRKSLAARWVDPVMTAGSEAGSRIGSGRQPAGPFLPGSGVLTPKAAIFVDRHQNPPTRSAQPGPNPGHGIRPRVRPARASRRPFFIFCLVSSGRVAWGCFLQICVTLRMASYCLAQSGQASRCVRIFPQTSSPAPSSNTRYRFLMIVRHRRPCPHRDPGRPFPPCIFLVPFTAPRLFLRKTPPKPSVTGPGAPGEDGSEKIQRTPRFSSQSLRSSLARCRRTFTVDSLIPRMRLVSSVEKPSKSLRLRTTL